MTIKYTFSILGQTVNQVTLGLQLVIIVVSNCSFLLLLKIEYLIYRILNIMTYIVIRIRINIK